MGLRCSSGATSCSRSPRGRASRRPAAGDREPGTGNRPLLPAPAPRLRAGGPEGGTPGRRGQAGGNPLWPRGASASASASAAAAAAAAGPAGLRGSAPGAHAAAGAALRQVSGGAETRGTGIRGAAGTGIPGRGLGMAGGGAGWRNLGHRLSRVLHGSVSRGPGAPAPGAGWAPEAPASREAGLPATPGVAGISTLGRGRHPGHRHAGLSGRRGKEG